MKNILTRLCAITVAILMAGTSFASSHREAPLIANDPLADNTDLYAFRSPDDPNTITIIANYVPLQLPHGGPNYYQFGENIRYEIHIDNDTATPGDDIIYRFTFTKTNEDPTTFFNIRLGQENLRTTYTMEKSTDGGATFSVVSTNGYVPPYNIGERSIQTLVGLGATDYESLFQMGIQTLPSGEKVFCGPVDDPFFVDLGGIFDLGDAPRQSGMPKDGVACKNVSTIAIQVPISMLQKDGKDVSMASSILDGDFVIGVWASASRPQIRTLGAGASPSYSGSWVQVSRLGMPLTNEAVIPIGNKDEWNSLSPYNENPAFFESFYNPELGLYMDDALFGGAVPALSPLRIQRNSLGAFDFGNGNDGLYGLKGSPAVAGTALDDAVFGSLLLPGPGKPRSVDLWPAFHTGVPNFPPYQLATGKGGNPLAAGKPFVNNFLPNGGDMLRLNMATPATDRNDPAFSSLGLIQAAVLGLTDPAFTSSANLEFIPNMDGFPNGRRLEDDVTRIELQAVSGVVLAAIGLWYDDFDPNDPNASPVTQDLLDVLTYSTGVESNDAPFRSGFPYVQMPWSGTGVCGGEPVTYQQPEVLPPTQSVTTFTLIDAKNDVDVMQINDGDTIDLAMLPTDKINFRADVNPGEVGSVVFGFNGDSTFRTENNAPYALAGSSKNNNPNYFQLVATPGQYSLKATPYAGKAGKGIAGVSRSIDFVIINSAANVMVTGFTLYNAKTDQPVGPLTDGMIIDLAQLGTTRINIVANTNPGMTGSVVFGLNGNPVFNIDNNAPYSAPGDNGNGEFFQLVVSPGSYTLTATPFTSKSGNGLQGMGKMVSFSVTGSSTARTANPQGSGLGFAYPNPAREELNINETAGVAGEVKIALLSALGQEVVSERFYVPSETWHYTINVADIPAGIYTLRIINGKNVRSERIVKIN